MNLWRFIKYYYFKFKRLQGSPHALAGGTAIGVFVGLTPTIPFHTLLIVFLSLVTRTSTLAGIIISWIVCNPLTYLPIYYLSALVGNHLTPYELNLKNVQSALEQAMSGDGIQNALAILVESGYESLVVMGIGGVCFALPFAIVSYYLALIFFVQIQKKRIKKRVLS
jgi:uncharacterized protein (DUF2062 family)